MWAANTPFPENEMDRLVSGPKWLEILWDETSRPSIRWLGNDPSHLFASGG